jgi:hypothetical protein
MKRLVSAPRPCARLSHRPSQASDIIVRGISLYRARPVMGGYDLANVDDVTAALTDSQNLRLLPASRQRWRRSMLRLALQNAVPPDPEVIQRTRSLVPTVKSASSPALLGAASPTGAQQKAVNAAAKMIQRAFRNSLIRKRGEALLVEKELELDPHDGAPCLPACLRPPLTCVCETSQSRCLCSSPSPSST